MGSEELLAKRLLHLAGYFKYTREPRGPEHMAKMKAARGPYSDPKYSVSEPSTGSGVRLVPYSEGPKKSGVASPIRFSDAAEWPQIPKLALWSST